MFGSTFLLLLFSLVVEIGAISEIQQLKIELQSMKTEIANLKTSKDNEIANLKLTMEKEKEDSKRKMDTVVKKLKMVSETCIYQEKGSENINVKRLLMNPTSSSSTDLRVAFTAALTHDVSLGELQTIEFDKVLTNIGGAYDARHGHFTAPVRGIYVISATILNVKGAEVHTEMVKNGVELVELYGDPSSFSQASQTLVLELQANDMIWVRHFLDKGPVSIYGRTNQPINSFSGVLLFQL